MHASLLVELGTKLCTFRCVPLHCGPAHVQVATTVVVYVCVLLQLIHHTGLLGAQEGEAMRAVVQQRLAEDAAAAARRRAAAAMHNLEVNAANAAMLARKKEAALKEVESDAAIAAYVRDREAREQVSMPEARSCSSVGSVIALYGDLQQGRQLHKPRVIEGSASHHWPDGSCMVFDRYMPKMRDCAEP